MSKGDTYVWVPQWFADEYQKITSDTDKIEILRGIIKATKNEMKTDVEYLEKESEQYKKTLEKYEKVFTKAYEEQRDKICKLWDDVYSSMPDIEKHAKKIQADLEPIVNKFKNLIEILEFSGCTRLTEMVKLVETIQNCDDKTKEVLLKVLESGKA
jgi:hypothetical protein